jgi:SagB-type dehydrogenase family enzyme
MKTFLSGIMTVVFLCPVAASGRAAEASGTLISLPEPRFRGSVSVEEALKNRRSIRQFSGRTLELENLSQLLWAAQGISDPLSGYRTAPSAGALYPLETFVFTPDGVYHYLPAKQALSVVRRGDFREDLARAALGQMWMQHASAVVVFTAKAKRTLGRYPKRGRDYILMETGHAAQNVLLQAVALGFVAVPVAAFYEQAIQEMLGVPADQRVLHLVAVGGNHGHRPADEKRQP